MRAASSSMTGRRRATFKGVGSGRATTAPPPLKPGQVRCPVCRNGTRTNVYGFLRRHRDLFGNDCYRESAVNGGWRPRATEPPPKEPTEL